MSYIPFVDDYHDHLAAAAPRHSIRRIPAFRDPAAADASPAGASMESQEMAAVGRLAGGIAHDFNNALQIMLVNAEFLQARLSGDAEGCAHAEEILAAGRLAAALTQQLLATGGRPSSRASMLDLNVATGNLETTLRRILGEDIRLTIACESDLGAITADAGQIEQLLINLAINARDAMTSGGRLSITTSSLKRVSAAPWPRAYIKPTNYAVMSVRDTGVGMDRPTQARIFEPYFTTKEPGKGTGLGLSSAYGIMQRIGGYITVDSAIGSGAEFRLFFPLSATAGRG